MNLLPLIQSGEVARLPHNQIPASAKFSQADPRWWSSGLGNFARDHLEPKEQDKLVNIAKGHIARKDQLENYNDRGVMPARDALIPIQHRVDIDPNITIHPNSIVTNNNIGRQAFASRVPADWRKDYMINLQIEDTLSYGRYCCGVDGPGGSIDIASQSSSATWYSTDRSFCWTDMAACTASAMVDLMSTLMSSMSRSLNQCIEDTDFYGDPEIGIRGVANSNCARLVLPTPLNELSWNDAVNQISSLVYSQTASETSAPFNRALVPQGYELLLAERKPDLPNAMAQREYIKEAISIAWQGISRKPTGRMQKIGRGANGRKNSPAMLLYNNDPTRVVKHRPTGIMFLPPCENHGMVKLQAIIKVGDLHWIDPSAGLLIENLLTSSNNDC